MLTLYSLFARFTTSGRRERRARKWDQLADRCASRKKMYAQVIACGSVMSVKQSSMDEFRLSFREAQIAEAAARHMASQIRRGER